MNYETTNPHTGKGTCDKITEISRVANEFPGIVIIHELPALTIRYISEKGLDRLEITHDEVVKMSNAEYLETFFNPDDARAYVPKVIELLNRNTDETVFFFQQIRTGDQERWEWYHSGIRILHRDAEGNPSLTITTAMRINPDHPLTGKVSRLLDENNFSREHRQKFQNLTPRERQILRLIALGKTAPEISEQLFISIATAETHRKNIRKKLRIRSGYEVAQYARAFDLI